jgi:CheY-like chemotaxis protein
VRDITILLVEDNTFDTLLAKRALNKVKIPLHIVVAKDGVEALDYLFFSHNDNKLPDIILLNLKLPRVDGLQVLKAIRASPKIKSLPVLVLTSSKDKADIWAARDLGATSYTVKPTNPAEYSRTIKSLILRWI